MKRQILSLTISTLVGVGMAFAAPVAGQSGDNSQAQGEQGRHWHQPDPAKQVQMLTKRLNLTTDQQNQILTVLNGRAEQMQAIRSDNSLSEQDRHAKMRSLRQETETKITAVLNAEQKQTYEQMQQQRRERSRENHQDSTPQQ